MSRTNVLVFVHIPTHFAEMLRVAQLLGASPRYRPIVMFNALYEGVGFDIEACRRQGIEVLTADTFKRYLPPRGALAGLPRILFGLRRRLGWRFRLGFRKAARAALAGAKWLFRLSRSEGVVVRALRTVSWLVLAPFVFLLRAPLRRASVAAFGLVFRRLPFLLPPDIANQRYFWRVLPRLVGENRVGLVVVPEDNFFYFTNLLIREVHERGGAALVVPFTIVNMLEWSEAFYREPACDARLLLNRVIAELFPAWTREHRGRR
ncbi:MAG: hypothetical protein KIS74_04490, partial [Burkholderiales bacterium]|nr:hypothetical protein [Burkholderiales bacterium]